jgi:hypothetical protein
MNKFEQLIEYVINDEDQKARELFHDIVVAKSREIYENLMQEEAEEDLDEAEVNEADDSDDDETDDEELDEGAMGGDASDDLIDEIEADEEQDMSMEAEGDDEMGDDEMGDDEGGDFGGDDMGGDDMGGSDEPATKDDVMNLEDKLDELMAEFEGLMGGGDDDMGDGDGFGPDEGGDAIGMDDTGEMEPGMMEAISLKAAPKPVTAEQGNGKAGPVAFNSGAAGMASKPVHTGTSMGGVHDSSAYRNTVKELGVTPTQDAGKKAFKSAAPAPVKSQASGVNTKSPLPSGRKG